MKTKWAKPAKFSAFLKKHRGSGEPTLLPEHVQASEPVSVLVHSWLLWESSSEQAATAMAKLVEQRVDFNELRVSLPHEVAGIIGKRYPRVEERLHGIRRTLHDLFLRRHELSFDYLGEKGKRDVKAEVESLDGITPFVSARLLRISFDVHAMPADDQLSALFHEHGVIDEPVEPEDLAGWLGTAVKADEATAAIASLQAAVDAAWDAGSMTKLVRKHRPLRVVEVVEVVETVAEDAAVSEREAAASKSTPKSDATASSKGSSARSTSQKSGTESSEDKSSKTQKASAKKSSTKKPTTKKSTAQKSTAQKSTTKKSTTKKSTAQKSTAKKSTSKKATSKKSTSKKATSKKATTRTSAAKKATPRKSATGRTAKKATSRTSTRATRSARSK